jgi:large subunit ribosomal protein L35
MKTRKAVAARFKRTGGKKLKLKRTRPGKRHILTSKRPNRKRKLKKSRLVDSGQVRMFAKMMGVKLS